MLPALNEIFTQQSKPTDNMINRCNRLLDYAAACRNIVIQCHASDMILHVNNYASYVVFPKARSRISGHLYLSDCQPTNNTPKPKLNSPILIIFQTIKHVLASA